jgi:hypothetical protein
MIFANSYGENVMLLARAELAIQWPHHATQGLCRQPE